MLLLVVTYLSLIANFDTSLCAGVAEHGQRRRIVLLQEGGVHASGAYPVEVRGFKSHPLHHLDFFAPNLLVIISFGGDELSISISAIELVQC
jgi:hypothetical protein